MSRRNRKKEWTIIVAAAVLLHALLFLSIRPQFFSAFKKTVSDDTRSGPSRPFGADAIVTIAIEIEDQAEAQTEQNPVQEKEDPAELPRKQQLDPPSQQPPSRKGDPDAQALEIESLTGQAPQTLPRSLGPQGLAIPPRPVEITWPDTRSLRHCLGHSIDVRIDVDEEGRVMDVQALSDGHPADCVAAAVESARRIIFEPGEIDGVPTRMWTQIRIDFRKKR